MGITQKVVVIVGPTATGKTKLAIKLAKRFNGEIVSADSRQVYRGMDIGTGKDLADYGQVPYHLIDVILPKTHFTVAHWQHQATTAIDDILKCGKLPIVVGGTGLYISALVEGYVFPRTQKSKIKNQSFHKALDTLSLPQLLIRLKKIDPATYKVIDKKNRRRVQRALEIFYQTGVTKSAQLKKQKSPYDFLIFGVTFPKEKLAKRITKRLYERLDQGMVAEVERLHNQGVSWKRLESFGLEYRFIALYLQKKLTYNEMVVQLEKAIKDFAKRQMTWFKRMPNMQWETDSRIAISKVSKFLSLDNY